MRIYRRLCAVFVSVLAVLLFTILANAQPPITHPLEGREDCLSCHEAGVGGAPQVPVDHTGRPNEGCQQCHAASGMNPDAVPAVSHPVEGREACLMCHAQGVGGASKIPDDHEGRPDESCLHCHLPAGTAPTAASVLPAAPAASHPLEGWEACLACHTEGIGGATRVPEGHAGFTDESCRGCHLTTITTSAQASPIPHLVEGREACLACHGEGVEGVSRIPDDHAGRADDECQACHRPPVVIMVTPAPPPIPTRVSHPVASGRNECLECHKGLTGSYAEIARQWEGSIHATHNVACVDCHGGDPGASDKTAAKSSESGYIGQIDKAAIPYLCGSCHSDAEVMRPYAIPIDQLHDYETSVHGRHLAEGDANAPTCYDCHGGHSTKAPDDPMSSIYPTQLPATCAECHADEERMRPYGIATNQFDLYRESVHGQALLVSGNQEAPSCPTCHSSHGATLQGYGEVVDICGRCHSESETYYLIGGHREGAGEGSEKPRCVTCHGRYDVERPSVDLFVGSEPRHCGSCHSADSLEGVAAEEMYQALYEADQALHGAESSLRDAQILAIGFDTQEARLAEAKAALMEAEAVQHAVDLDAVREKTNRVEAISAEVLASVEQATARRELLRVLPGWIVVAAVGLGAAVVYVARRLRMNRSGETSQ